MYQLLYYSCNDNIAKVLLLSCMSCATIFLLSNAVSCCLLLEYNIVNKSKIIYTNYRELSINTSIVYTCMYGDCRFILCTIRRYQQTLHRNLVFLAGLADPNLNIQSLLPVRLSVSPWCKGVLAWSYWSLPSTFFQRSHFHHQQSLVYKHFWGCSLQPTLSEMQPHMICNRI